MDYDEYQDKLLARLYALIAVLEIAIRKIQYSMTQPHSDEIRLDKIYTNLKNTMNICIHAKRALEGDRGGEVTSEHIWYQDGSKVPLDEAFETNGRLIEMSSADEHKKFQGMPPITAKEIKELDWVEFIGRFKEL